MNKPATVQIKARDVKPYHYRLWCSIMDGEPFANEIVGVCRTDDGEHLTFMLDSHNFMCNLDPDEELELVPRSPEPGSYLAKKFEDWALPDPPPRKIRCEKCGAEFLPPPTQPEKGRKA